MKFFFIFSLFIIFFFNTFSKNLLAEENFLTLKQQIDRLQREVNDLSKLVFQSPESSNNIDNEQTVNFAAIDNSLTFFGTPRCLEVVPMYQSCHP